MSLRITHSSWLRKFAPMAATVFPKGMVVPEPCGRVLLEDLGDIGMSLGVIGILGVPCDVEYADGALVVGFQRSYGIDERHRPAEGVGRHPGIREQVH